MVARPLTARASQGAGRLAHTVTARAVDAAWPDAPAPLREAVRVVATPGVERLVRWLDDGLRIPGTGIRVGLDPIVGLILPGAGDAIGGAGALLLLVHAVRRRVPPVILARMLLHIALDALVGALPVVGDVFDVFFHSNRRNLRLIERYAADTGRRPGPLDYAIVTAAAAIAIAGVFAPFLLMWALLALGLGTLPWWNGL
ncbi:MAG: DUF4112 domain-containing protein, partial [Myxococcales bacterium]|nr:DUF4112 domain-containing protein [Myxococcales bacterium]